MRKQPEPANLGFDDVDLYCVRDGVKTVGPGHRPIRARLRDVEAYQPCLVFMHIGEDLGSMPPGNITWELTQLVNELIPLCSNLIVGQLLSFPRYCPHHHHDVTLINGYLRRDVPRPRLLAPPVRIVAGRQLLQWSLPQWPWHVPVLAESAYDCGLWAAPLPTHPAVNCSTLLSTHRFKCYGSFATHYTTIIFVCNKCNANITYHSALICRPYCTAD